MWRAASGLGRRTVHRPDQRRESASVAVVTPLLYVSRPVGGELKVYICRDKCMAVNVVSLLRASSKRRSPSEGDSDPWCVL